ncbi:MAG: hypothetical protein V4495_21890 [Pseudomonadota bacterium]
MNQLLGNLRALKGQGLLVQRMQGQQGLQLAMELSQHPTPKMAKKIIEQLKKIGNPYAERFEQLLTSAQGDAVMIKRMADAAVASLSGGHQE